VTRLLPAFTLAACVVATLAAIAALLNEDVTIASGLAALAVASRVAFEWAREEI
jgi:hypothetical protein